MKLNEKIDILKFYTEVDYKRWNEFLTNCYRKADINKLIAMRNGFQQGMADLAKNKMESEKISIFFIRIQRSIDNTIKAIFRDKNPNPLYDPLYKDPANKFHEDKKRKQNELEEFIKRHNY